MLGFFALAVVKALYFIFFVYAIADEIDEIPPNPVKDATWFFRLCPRNPEETAISCGFLFCTGLIMFLGIGLGGHIFWGMLAGCGIVAVLGRIRQKNLAARKAFNVLAGDHD